MNRIRNISWVIYLSDDNLMLLDYKTWSLLHNPINAFHVQTTVMLHH